MNEFLLQQPLNILLTYYGWFHGNEIFLAKIYLYIVYNHIQKLIIY